MKLMSDKVKSDTTEPHFGPNKIEMLADTIAVTICGADDDDKRRTVARLLVIFARTIKDAESV